MIPTIRAPRKTYAFCALILIFILMGWSVRHIFQIVDAPMAWKQNEFAVLWLLVFGSLIWHLGLAWLEKPYTVKTKVQD